MGGVQRVKDHEFFDGVDWDAVYERRTGKGPIVPKVEWAGDAGNFDEYPDPPKEGDGARYTSELRKAYEESFRDF